jgi:UTP-glucose-1-phosphate uridylyltransferase
MKPHLDKDEPLAVLLPDNIIFREEGEKSVDPQVGKKNPEPEVGKSTTLRNAGITVNTLLQMIPLLSRAKGVPIIGITSVDRNSAFRFSNCGRIEYRNAEKNLLQITGLDPKGNGVFDLQGEDSAFRVMGRYIIFSNFLDVAAELKPGEGSELDDTGIFQTLLRTCGLMGVLLRGDVYDVGNPQGYTAANMRVSLV